MKTHCHQLRKNPLPSIEWLRARYTYEGYTGRINGPDGKVVGRFRQNGYVRVSVLSPSGRRIEILAHRLAFALLRGRWPGVIHHRNGNRSDNRLKNIREVTQAENMMAMRRDGISQRRNAGRIEWVVSVGRQRSSNGQCSRARFCDAVKLRQAAVYEIQAGLPPGPLFQRKKGGA